LIGTVRRELLDHTLFWNAHDLERKLADFQSYYNQHRTHRPLSGETPSEVAERTFKLRATLNNYR
jgi:transposase InsO family protein